MVEFGRVHGIVEPLTAPPYQRLLLTVTLETRDAVTVVRSQPLEPIRAPDTRDELFWHADQWTQETIGVDLAEQGWEVLGMSDTEHDHLAGPPRSATYSVRRLFLPPAKPAGPAGKEDVVP